MKTRLLQIMLCLFLCTVIRDLRAQEQIIIANEEVRAQFLARSHPILLQWLDYFEDDDWAEYEIHGKSETILDKSRPIWVREIFQQSFCSPDVQRHTTRWKGSAHARDLCGATWLQFPDRFVVWENAQSLGSVICIMPNSSPEVRRDGRAMNPKLVAFMGTVAIPTLPDFSGSSWVLGRECGDVTTSDDGLKTVSIIPIPSVRAMQKGAYIRTEATFDESKGMVPVRVRRFQMWKGSSPEGFLTQEIDSEYIQVEDQWLPSRIRILKHSHEYEDPKFKCTLKIEWKSVGKPLDPSIFDVNNFGASKGKSIVDFRLSDKGVTVSRIGSCGPDGSPLPPDAPIAEFLSEEPAGYSTRVKTIIGVNATLLVSLCLLFFWRRRSAHSQSTDSNKTP